MSSASLPTLAVKVWHAGACTAHAFALIPELYCTRMRQEAKPDGFFDIGSKKAATLQVGSDARTVPFAVHCAPLACLMCGPTLSIWDYV